MAMRKESGITMAEIMIVIAIIGILSAIAVPGFIKWIPRYRLKGAVSELYSNMQAVKMDAIKSRTNWAIVFKASVNPGKYFICSASGDGDWTTLGDNTIAKTVNMSDYGSGVDFGHGNANKPIGAGWGDHITYNSPNNVAVFNAAGNGNTGYVYLDNKNNDDTFAVGTLTSGVVRLRKYYGGKWK